MRDHCNTRFVSDAARLGLRGVFAVDLTPARANGTMWDLSLEDDRSDLQRLHNRVQLELLVGSPPSDDFSSLLNTCLKPQEISATRAERKEPHIRTAMQAYKLQMEMQKHFIHEHLDDSTSWRRPEVQSLASDPRVYSIVGAMYRWGMKARRSNNEEEFMSRLVCRVTKNAKNKHKQLGPEDVFSPMPKSEGFENAGGHDDGNHTEGPIEMAT